MNGNKYRHLFSPIKIGKSTFSNRLFASPQDYPGLTSNRFLTEEAVHFYERKAQGGFSSVCVGDVMVDGQCGRSHPFQMRGDDPMGKVNFTRVATGIKRHGSVAAVELVHAGKNANVMLMPPDQQFVYGPSEEIRHDGVEIREMREEHIEALIMHYADSAALAKQCGFGMITLHGGHGWQISQFLSPRDNRRTDRWGGSIENRMRFPLEVIDAVRGRIGPDIPIEFRLSVSECLGDDGYGIEEGVRIAQLLDGKIDLINASVGHHEIDASSMITMPSMFLEDGCNIEYAMALKKAINTPVSTVGALTNPEMMEEIIASGKADIVEIGRQTLADPDLPIKARLGLEEEITPCIRCFNCFSTSTVGGVFYCAVNPEIGRELATKSSPRANKQKKVLIAGGGVGGMQAALTASERGHEVILCEKNNKLGGTLLCEEKVPFKANLDSYIKGQAKKVCKAPVEVRLNTFVTPDLVKKFAPDVIIAAMGARPALPPIKGIEQDHVHSAEDIYYNPELCGNSAVIIGGGLVGLELGVYLARSGRDITIIEAQNGTLATPPPVTGTSNRMSGIMDVAVGYPLVHGVAIKEEVKKYPNLKIMVSVQVIEILDNGIIVEVAGETQTLPADTVIYATGQRPLSEEAYALAEYAPEFYVLGDCVKPDNIYSATSVAYQTALNIGRY